MALTTRYLVVNTDNFGGDYPNEHFVNLPATTKDNAQKIADVINQMFNPTGGMDRYWVVRLENYKLQPGFEP